MLKLKDDYGRSCLHAAARAGSPEIAEALLEAAGRAELRAELLKLKDDEEMTILLLLSNRIK